MYRYIIVLALISIFSSCVPEGEDFEQTIPEGMVDGFVPIYQNEEQAYNISVSAGKEIVNPGKIFTYQNFLIVTIINEGFHVIDNSNPSSPNNLFFVNIPGNTDIAVKNDVFFANNYNDMISFYLNENGELDIIERLSDAMQNGLAPTESNVYFECVDPLRGVVVGWESRIINRPRCYKQ